MDKRFNPTSKLDHKQQQDFYAAASKEQTELIDRAHTDALNLKGKSLKEILMDEENSEERERIQLALTVVEEVRSVGGMALVVGGYVRDEALRRMGRNIKPKDLDLEVYGLQPDALYTLLEKLGETRLEGEQFAAYKLGGLDITLPRRDSKKSEGHRGFDVEADPFMSIEEAARRRDLTINALLLDPSTGEIIDKHNGIRDLQDGVLRAVDAETFPQDPLRPMRVVQFAGRFGFKVDPSTEELCKEVVQTKEFKNQPQERIGSEWEKLFNKAEWPSIGLEVAKRVGIIERLHPELHVLAGVEQEPEWHPEGDVWTHTLMVVDQAATLIRNSQLHEDLKIQLTEEQKGIVLFAALCHDLGKAATTSQNAKGQIISHGHEEAGVEPTQRLLSSWNISEKKRAAVAALVNDHLFPAVQHDPTKRALNHLAARLNTATIEMLTLVSMADNLGRGYLSATNTPEVERKKADFEQKVKTTMGRIKAFLQKSRELQIAREKPKDIILGRHLLSMGIKPGKQVGAMLGKIKEAQYSGEFQDEQSGITWVKEHFEDLKLGK